MRRTLLVVTVCIGLLGVSVPAFAAVDRNPNATELTNVSCPEIGLVLDAIWIPSESLAGHDLDGNLVGVAKSLFATDSEGNPIVEVLHRSGKGLDNVTVWCFWPDAESPTGFVGGDILFRRSVRS